MEKDLIKERLWRLVDERKQELLELCAGLIRIPSENPPGEMEEVTGFICNYLKSFGIEHQIVRPEADKPNIVADMGNGKGKTLLMNGHSDVVPAGDRSKWNFDPFCGEITPLQILGRGTSDMKAGLGALLFVMGLLGSVEGHGRYRRQTEGVLVFALNKHGVIKAVAECGKDLIGVSVHADKAVVLRIQLKRGHLSFFAYGAELAACYNRSHIIKNTDHSVGSVFHLKDDPLKNSA
jgi:hypothetical protein